MSIPQYKVPELAKQLQTGALTTKKGIVFGLDDVLFPGKDYLLQVYYLFANFVEFTAAHPPAGELLGFLRTAYEQEGPGGLFDKAAAQYPEVARFRENFDRLHHQAQLPLKLLVYPEAMELMRKIHADGKFIFILTAGDPLMQLNKIRQVEWEGLDKVLKVYFEAELRFAGHDPMRYLMDEHGLQEEELVCVGCRGDRPAPVY